MSCQQEWDDLFIYLAQPQSVDLVNARLERVSGPWPQSLSQLQRTLELAARHRLQELLVLHLIAHVLTAGRRAPGWIRSWLTRDGLLQAFLPDMTPKEAFSLGWSAVPVPIVRVDGRGCVFRMMAAPRPGASGVVIPEWAKENLEADFQQAVSTALEAARSSGLMADPDMGFYCWPLMDPGGPLLRGESLGLTLAMAFSLLSRGSAWPVDLMATGGIRGRGEVLPVGGLQAKVQAAAESGIKLFLYPDEERIDFNNWPIPALPVNDLHQAMTFAQLVALGLPALSNFRLYYSCLQDAKLMLDNYHQLPPEVLLWARERGLLQGLKQLVQEAELFPRAVERLNDRGLSLCHRQVLASLLGEQEVDLLARRSSQDALNVCNWYHNLQRLAEETGRPEEAGHWKRKAGLVLREFGNKIYVFYRTEEHHPCYENFDRSFERQLASMEPGPMREAVERAWRKRLVFLHLPIRQGDHVSARVFLNEKNQMVGLSLNAASLQVDPETGQARSVSDCLHAVYLGLIRAAFVANRQKLLRDKTLHGLLAEFLHRLLEAVLENHQEPVAEDGPLLAAACRYYYLQRFLELDPTRASQWQALGRRKATPADQRRRLLQRLDGQGAQDLSTLLAQLELTPHADWLRHRLPLRLGQEAALALGGMLDMFLGICVLALYPRHRFATGPHPPTEVSRQVESRLLPLLKHLEYSSQTEPARPHKS
jgi:hypothetical protein